MSDLQRPPATPAQIDQARAVHQSDEVQIDNDALTSHAGNGIWVQAWVWLPKEEGDADN
jgi:hypothetical protein